jgi:glycosyltransferase involved in cell wall biosynthesis
LLIFTDHYPYGSSESFFQTELENISKAFNNLVIFPLDCSSDISRKRITPENVEIITPVFKSYKSKATLTLCGVFNFSPIAPFVAEFFRSECWKSIPKFRNWFVHLILTRALIHSFNKTFSNKKNEEYILYFYWGLRWSQVLPFVNLAQKKVVVRFHGSDLYDERNNGYIPFRKEQLKKIDLAVFVSEMGKNYLIDKYKHLLRETFVARLGTEDYGKGVHSEDKAHIVSCSNIIPLKQIDLLVRALKFISLEVQWTHIGDGPLKGTIVDLTSELGKNVTVCFKGQLTTSELMKFYKETPVSVFINTSLSEGVPVSVMEALSFGVPVIATDVGGTKEIVDEKVGYLVSASISPDDLARKIEELINRTDYLILRSNARRRWEERCQARILYTTFVNKLKSL